MLNFSSRWLPQGALEQAMLANPALAAQHPELQRKADKVRSEPGAFPCSLPVFQKLRVLE